jgi:hypothetical protein
MATIGFQLAYGNPHVVHLPESETSNSFTDGDIVYMTGGYVALASNDGTVFGVALADAVGTTGNSTPVHVISPEDIFIVQMETDSTTTHIGTDAGINLTAGGQSVATGSADSVVIIDFFEPVGTAVGKVLVKFVPGALQSGVGQ